MALTLPQKKENKEKDHDYPRLFLTLQLRHPRFSKQFRHVSIRVTSVTILLVSIYVCVHKGRFNLYAYAVIFVISRPCVRELTVVLLSFAGSQRPLRELRCQRITMRVADTRMCQRQRGKRSSMAIKITIRSPQT